MKRYDRTWPTAVLAIGLGATAGWALMRSGTTDTIDVDVAVEAPRARAVPEAPVVVRLPSRSPAQVAQARMVDRVIARKNTETLLEQLRRSEDVRERRHAAIRLGTTQDPEHVLGALMIALRSDPDETVRFMAAEAIGRLGSAAAVGPLHVSLVRDADVRVREAAASALGVIGHGSAVPGLSQALASDRSDDVRIQAARSLAGIGSEESWAAVARAQQTDASERVRQRLFDLIVGR